jgi:peroxiredoxin
VVLGLNSEPKHQPVVDFAGKTFTYPLLLDARPVYAQYRVRSIPCTFIIDRDGKIVSRHAGFAPGHEKGLEDSLKQLLAEPTMSPALSPQPGSSR